MDQQTLEIYNERASEYAQRYEDFGSSEGSLLPHLFHSGETVLDIGCGSGRDISFLLKLGIDAYGIEPSGGMIKQALTYHPELNARVFRGHLPDSIPTLPVERFSGILLSAILMHIPDELLFSTACTLRSLLREGGKLVISIPEERNDINPRNQRDDSGRLMLLRPESRISLLFERLGFTRTNRWHSADRLRRPGIKWVTLVFTYSDGTVSESVDKIESIINRDKKTATYKLALMKALCDISQQETNTVSWDTLGNVKVPVDSIVRKWIEYYWPVVDSDTFIPQTRGEDEYYDKPIAFRKSLKLLAAEYENIGGLTQFVFDRDRRSITTDAQAIFREVRKNVRNAVIKGPVYYAGGGLSKDKPFSYDKADKTVTFHSDIWRELVLLGHWIGDSITMKWAELTKELSHGSLEIPDIVSLLMNRPQESRDVALSKDIFTRLPTIECVWTGKELKSTFDVDHAIPYVLRHDNSLWNLFPADSKVNNAKRDKLPSENLIVKSRARIIFYWEQLYTNDQSHSIFEIDYLRFTGKDSCDRKTWKDTLLWTFREAVETTASRRGVARWEG